MVYIKQIIFYTYQKYKYNPLIGLKFPNILHEHINLGQFLKYHNL